MSELNTNDPRQVIQQRMTRLFEKYRAEGLAPNEAAARAVLEIKKVAVSSASSSAQSSIPNSSINENGHNLNASSTTLRTLQPLTPEDPAATQDATKTPSNHSSSTGETESKTNLRTKPFATTNAVDFLDYLKESEEEDLVTHILNIFAHPCNLAHSFQLQTTSELDMVMDTESPSDLTHTLNDANLDWDGLKRVYDEIEQRGCPLELVLIDAVKRMRHERANVTPDILHISLVMTLVNPHIASPSYLDSAFIGICRVISELTEAAQIDMVKILSRLSCQDLLQIVRNVQQSITIRCLEMDEAVEVHEDDRIACFVRTLRLLFYAALFGTHEDEDWRSNLQKISGMELVSMEELDNRMDTDDVDDKPEMSEDDRSINEILHRQREAKTTEDQDPLAKTLKLDWCNLSRPRIPYAEFLNETVNNGLDVEKDFVNYKFGNEDEEDTSSGDKFSFMNHPFILNTKEKTLYLFYDSRVKQIQHRRRAQMNMLFNGTITLPYLILKVSRDNIIQDALIRLEFVAADNPAQLQKQLVVEFDGEEGVDEGGVSKEFFTLALEEILKPDYGMFRFNDDTGYHQFNPIQFQETEKEYMLIGMLLGLAIYNGINLDIAFPTVIFKKLLGYDGTFEDLEFSHPDVYRSMTQVLEADKESVDSMALTFSVSLESMFGEPVEYDLVKNGKERPVTNSNKFHFVEVYADFLLNKSIKKSFNAFKRGFELVTDNSPLPDLFRPEELENLVIGQRKYDWETLQEICEYDGGFNKNHETIQHFWSVFDEMEESEKKLLLEFFTGSDRVPVGGLSRLKPKIQSSGPDSDRLPTAHTCFNILLLPAYKSREKLKERLTKAIENAKGFGMI